MLTKCPHCFRGVIPYDDGRCPSCQSNVNHQSKSQLEKTRIVVDETTDFPKICCTCGSATADRTKISHGGEVATGVGPRKFAAREPSIHFQMFLFLVFGWISRLFFSGVGGATNRANSTIVVRIPQCKPCHKATPINPESVDLERHRIAFIVHRRFAEMIGK